MTNQQPDTHPFPVEGSFRRLLVELIGIKDAHDHVWIYLCQLSITSVEEVIHYFQDRCMPNASIQVWANPDGTRATNAQARATAKSADTQMTVRIHQTSATPMRLIRGFRAYAFLKQLPDWDTLPTKAESE